MESKLSVANAPASNPIPENKLNNTENKEVAMLLRSVCLSVGLYCCDETPCKRLGEEGVYSAYASTSQFISRGNRDRTPILNRSTTCMVDILYLLGIWLCVTASVLIFKLNFGWRSIPPLCSWEDTMEAEGRPFLFVCGKL